MGLPSFNFCGGLRNTHLYCNSCVSAVSSQVDDFSPIERAYVTSCSSLIVTLVLPHCHLTPSLGVNPFEFLDKLCIAKTRVLRLSAGEDFVILACVVLTQCQRVTDGQTDGRTDIQTVANTGLCIASYMPMPCKNRLTLQFDAF